MPPNNPSLPDSGQQPSLDGQFNPTPAPPPPSAPESDNPSPAPVKLPRKHHPLGIAWAVLTIVLIGVAIFGTYVWQRQEVKNANGKISTLEAELQDKKEAEAKLQEDDKAVLVSVKNYCEGQLSLDSKQPREFTAAKVNNKEVYYGGDKEFAQVKVDCRDVSDSGPLQQVPYILKKTNGQWYVIEASMEPNEETVALFGIPSIFDE